MKETVTRNDEWQRCKKCGHKLFRKIKMRENPDKKMVLIEVKCHSCKEINLIEL